MMYYCNDREHLRPIIVGQAPCVLGQTIPFEPGGARYLEASGLLRLSTFFDLANIFDHPTPKDRVGVPLFPMADARTRAAELIPLLVLHPLVIVAGPKVASALGIKPPGYFERGLPLRYYPPHPTPDSSGQLGFMHEAPVVMVPHPSGRCRMWNCQDVRRRAADFFAEIIESWSQTESLPPALF